MSNGDVHPETRIQTACLMLIAAVIIVVTLYWLKPVLMPFILAVFLVCSLAPLLDLIQQRTNAPRIVAVAIAFLGGVLVIAALWLFIWLSIASLLNDSQIYRAQFQELVARVEGWLPERLRGADAPADPSAGADIDPAAKSIKNIADGGAPRRRPSPELSALTDRYVSQGLSMISSTLMDGLGSASMVLIFMFFLLLGGSRETLPRSSVWQEIEGKIRGYIATKTLISVLTGAVFGFVLWLYGIPLAIVFALLAFLLNFIPNVRPIAASLLPVPLIVLSPDLSVASMVIVILLTSGIQFISGNVVEPKVMGESFDLHPVAVLLTLMVWGMLWGIVGMILAVPMTAAIKILLEQFEHTRSIAYLLAGRFDKIRQTGEAG